jgi:hypothetical protein
VDVEIHVFLTSGLVGSEYSDSRAGRFIPGTHKVVGLVGPRTSLDDVERRKILSLLALGRPHVASRYAV